MEVFPMMVSIASGCSIEIVTSKGWLFARMWGVCREWLRERF